MLEELRKELYDYARAGMIYIKNEELTEEEEIVLLSKLYTLLQVIDVMDDVLEGEKPRTAVITGFKHKKDE